MAMARLVSTVPETPPACSHQRRVCPQVILLVAVFALAASGLRVAHVGRRGAVLGACAAATRLPAPARAAEGQKSDKSFQTCLSKCVYDVTKITKGISQVEVISRQEAYAQCKPKCATSKDQLLIGQPKK